MCWVPRSRGAFIIAPVVLKSGHLLRSGGPATIKFRTE